MPPADAASLDVAPSALTTVRRTTVTGWGRGPGADVRSVRLADGDRLTAALERCRRQGYLLPGAIARGMGRSYGDAAQLSGGAVIDTTGWKGFEVDGDHGTVTAEAGVTLAELLDALVPAGWVVPVLPGTQHVSVGGAIAADIHGKNHGVAGTFGAHVEALGLLISQGEARELSAEDGDPLFGATLGGMGLTGVITWARIRLRPIDSPMLSVDTDRGENLDELLAALQAPGGPHRVAWLDLLGSRPVRGVVTRADHVRAGDVPAGATAPATVSARASVPNGWPGGLLRPATVRLFNQLRFGRTPQRERGKLESLARHMFPLDALASWPRLYGPLGLVQYQLVVPFGAQRTLEAVIERLRRSQVPCYLAVLKDFGEAGQAPLSFPLPGWTLALDLPRAADGLDALLDGFDELVADAGGRVYLAKDARTRPDVLRATYPRLEEWREVQASADPEGVWRSDLAERTGLVPARGAAAGERGAGARGAAAGERAPDRGEDRPAPHPPDAERVLLLGGTSEIGLAIVRRLARDAPVRPYLLGRDRDRLVAALADLERSGCAEGELDVLDAEDLDRHPDAVTRAFERMDGFDIVVLAIGVLGAQAGIDADRDEALEVMRINFAAAGSLLLEALRRLEAQGAGTLVVLSSVAAERPRASNAVYGAAKAGLDSLAQGLADASAGTGVRVLVVRPGFVRTKMTDGLEPAPMAATAAEVAEATVRGLEGTAHTVWVPARLRIVFAVLRHLPRSLFRRLPL